MAPLAALASFLLFFAGFSLFFFLFSLFSASSIRHSVAAAFSLSLRPVSVFVVARAIRLIQQHGASVA